MNNLLSKAFFVVCAFLVVKDLAAYVQIQHEFQPSSLVPLLLLGILGHFAFERRSPAA